MAHLTGWLARDAPNAVLRKDGPGRRCCTIGWERTNDTFEVAQWLGHRIQAMDLSPDGRYLLYVVNRQWYGNDKSCYQVVSRAPWLKALTFWSRPMYTGMFMPGGAASRPHGRTPDRRPGPGVREPRIHRPPDGGPPPDYDHLGLEVTHASPFGDAWPETPIQFLCLERDGWNALTPYESCPDDEAAMVIDRILARHRIVLDKRHRGWTLRQRSWWGEVVEGQENLNNGYFETFDLISPTGEVTFERSWEWADLDTARDRIVFTRDLRLYASTIEPAGLAAPKLLFDASDLTFEARSAPY